MTYATYDDLVWISCRGYGSVGKLCELHLTKPGHKAVIGAALTDATEAIEGYAASRYRIPLDPVPAPVRRWCADMAFYYLHTAVSAPEGVRKAFEDALAGLKDMARGVIVFQAEGVPTANTDASGGVLLDVPSRIISPDNHKGC